MNDFSPEQLRELFALAIEKEINPNIKLLPGTKEIQGIVTISVDVVITKKLDEEYCPTNKFPLKNILGAMIERFGVSEEEITELIVETYKESINKKTTVNDILDVSPDTMNIIEKIFSQVPKAEREGKTDINGFVRLLSVFNNNGEQIV